MDLLFLGRVCNGNWVKHCTGYKWYFLRPVWRRLIWSSYTEIQQLAKKIGSKLFARCYEAILNNTGALNRTLFGYSDIYYVPRSRVEDFLAVGSVFFRHGVFLEIAVPNTLACINQGETLWIQGMSQARQSTRLKPWMNIEYMYNHKNLVFYHATKWTHVLKNDNMYRKLYCNISQRLYSLK